MWMCVLPCCRYWAHSSEKTQVSAPWSPVWAWGAREEESESEDTHERVGEGTHLWAMRPGSVPTVKDIWMKTRKSHEVWGQGASWCKVWSLNVWVEHPGLVLMLRGRRWNGRKGRQRKGRAYSQVCPTRAADFTLCDFRSYQSLSTQEFSSHRDHTCDRNWLMYHFFQNVI